MFHKVNSLFSLPSISKWNKNNNINKDDLLLYPEFKICKWDEKYANKIKGELSVILIGGHASGKTAIYRRLINNKFIFIEQNQNTFRNSDFQFLLIFKKIKIKLLILYTYGADKLKDIFDSFAKDCNGIIFVFDITNKNQINAIKDRISIKTDNHECIILANKCDLKEKREITKKEILKLEKDCNIKVFEVSTKTGENFVLAIEEFFKNLLIKKRLI